MGTVQCDFAQPLRFDLHYVGSDGKEHMPYIVHRAPLGAFERMVAFLIEHFGGAFPSWLAPTQVRVIPVGEAAYAYGDELLRILRDELVRADIDTSDNSFNKKIREAVTHKIPNMLIVGGKEAEQRTVTLRRYAVKEQVTMPLENFMSYLKKVIGGRIMDNFPDEKLPQ